jgi:hypothetical protein
MSKIIDITEKNQKAQRRVHNEKLIATLSLRKKINNINNKDENTIFVPLMFGSYVVSLVRSISNKRGFEVKFKVNKMNPNVPKVFIIDQDREEHYFYDPYECFSWLNSLNESSLKNAK